MVQVEPLLQFSPLCCLHISIYNMGRLVILINIVVMMKMARMMTMLPSSFIYSATQNGFPCHHYSHCSNRGHHCIIASKNDNEFMIDHDSSDDQNDSNYMDIKIIWRMTTIVLWSTSPIVLPSSSADRTLSHSLTLPKSDVFLSGIRYSWIKVVHKNACM